MLAAEHGLALLDDRRERAGRRGGGDAPGTRWTTPASSPRRSRWTSAAWATPTSCAPSSTGRSAWSTSSPASTTRALDAFAARPGAQALPRAARAAAHVPRAHPDQAAGKPREGARRGARPAWRGLERARPGTTRCSTRAGCATSTRSPTSRRRSSSRRWCRRSWRMKCVGDLHDPSATHLKINLISNVSVLQEAAQAVRGGDRHLAAVREDQRELGRELLQAPHLPAGRPAARGGERAEAVRNYETAYASAERARGPVPPAGHLRGAGAAGAGRGHESADALELVRARAGERPGDRRSAAPGREPGRGGAGQGRRGLRGGGPARGRVRPPTRSRRAR